MLGFFLTRMIPSLIFFPEKTFYEKPEDYGFHSQDVIFQTKDAVNLHGWFLAPPEGKGSAGALLFLHGNAGNISHRLFKVKGWVERGFSVFLIDYRGYGRSQGKIGHEDDLFYDAQAAIDWLREAKGIPLSKIVLYGESIGSAPAVRLASEESVAAVILEAPFTDFFDLAKTHYPFVPEMLLKDFEFSNLSRIRELKAPLFILHGQRDEICPFQMAEELFEKAPEPKGFLSVPNGAHNDLPMAAGDDYWQKPYEFVMKYLP